MGLNAKQKKVVDHDGHQLCVAVPGSGKTFTLVARCLRLLKNSGKTILMITFTRAGADEMANRLAAAGADMERVTVKTFHSCAIKQMRDAGNISKFLTSEKPSMVDRALRAVGVKMGIKDAMFAVDYYGMKLCPKRDPDVPGWEVYVAYMGLLQQYGLEDFNSIARKTVIEMQDGNLKPMQFDFILVDEFQDTDEVQLSWVKEHIRAGSLVTCVGDDDQSIYSFRGGLGISGMVDFQKLTNAQAFQLDTCYRCAPEVLKHANYVIKHNKDRVDKDLESGKEPGGSVNLVRAFEPTEELDKLIEGISEEPFRWAILARGNLTLDEIESRLSAEEIEYKRLGGGSFWDHSSISLYMGLLEYMVNDRHQHGLESFLAWQGEAESVLRLIHQSLFEVNFEFLPDEIFQFAAPATQEFRSEYRKWKQQLNRDLGVGQICESVADWMKRAKPKRADGRIAGMVARIIGEMDAHLTLRERLAKLKSKIRSSGEKKEEESQCLTLSTLHSCKGLEWPKVWMFNCADGVIPSEKSPEEEERRLFYVGMTRAESDLVVSYNHRASPFVREAFPGMEFMEDETGEDNE